MTKDEGLLLAKQFKSALQEAKIPFQSMIVFGSVARDNVNEHSDVDIAVIGASFIGNRSDEAVAVRRVRRPISYKIQPIWIYPEQLENDWSGLAREIKKDGIEI